MKWWTVGVVVVEAVELGTGLKLLKPRKVAVSGGVKKQVVCEALEEITGWQYEATRAKTEILPGCEEDLKFVVVEGEEPGSDALDVLSAVMDGHGGALCLGAGKRSVHAAEAAAKAHAEYYGLVDPADVENVDQDVQKVRCQRVLMDAEARNGRFDSSELAIIDGLVDDRLRMDLLDAVGGASDTIDTRKWVRGGLGDTVGGSEGQCWGLAPKALDELCASDAVVRLQSRIRTWLQHANPGHQFVMSRMPASCLGDDISPVTANAPVRGDVFGFHVDADPFLLPPSPWRDFFGPYVNRDPGRPRFVTALAYLSPPPFGTLQYGAPTRFRDPPTSACLDVLPVPGRLVLLDQDLEHAVVPPGRGLKPRYSLAIKLVLHPHPHGHPLFFNAHHSTNDNNRKKPRNKNKKVLASTTTTTKKRTTPLHSTPPQDTLAVVRLAPEQGAQGSTGEQTQQNDAALLVFGSAAGRDTQDNVTIH